MKNSIEEQLLHSSLLCGLSQTGNPAYRLQLFFIANKDLSSKSHQADFQRAIETGVDEHKLWKNYGKRGSGEYLITELGYSRATKIFGNVKPIYPPISGKDYHILIRGKVKNLFVEIETIGNRKKSTKVFIDHQLINTAKEACKIIENKINLPLETKGESAVRVLYNFAIDRDFDFIWKGKIL